MVVFLLLACLVLPAASPAGVKLYEGFDLFDQGRRPPDWEFIDCDGDEDVYTGAGNYGLSSPSLRLDETGDRVLTPEFPAEENIFLNFWIKGFATDASSALLVDEGYGNGGWSVLTEILPLSTSGTSIGPLGLASGTTGLRFTYEKSAGNLGLDDVLIRSGQYMRVYYLSYTRLDETGRYGQIIYAELPGPDGILGTDDDVNVLYDGGATSSSDSALADFLDGKIGEGGTIQHMVLSHAHADHYRGLDMAVERYQVENYYENFRGGSSTYETFRDKIDAYGIQTYEFAPGDYLSGPETSVGLGWDPNIEVKVLAAPETGDPNTDSGVLLVRNRDSVQLWGADATFFTEDYVLEHYPEDLAQTDIYAVHHHGSAASSGADFLEQMGARYAIVPVAFRSTSRHPHQEAMDRIDSAGAILYRNDLDHDIIVLCDPSGNYEITRTHIWDGAYSSSADLVYPPPPPVSGLNVSRQTVDHLVLEWDSTGAGDRYLVFRSPFPGGDDGAGRALQAGMDPGQETGIYRRLTGEPVSYTTFTDASGSPGTTYHYRVATVRSYSAGGYTTTQERRWSNEASGARLLDVPSPTPEDYRTPTPPPTPVPTATPAPTPSIPPTRTPTPTPAPTPPLPPGVIFSESFDEGLPASWTVIDGYDDGYTWRDDNPGGRSHSALSEPFMIVDSDWSDERPMDEHLITPSIDCRGFENVELRFSHWFRYYRRGGPEKGDVCIRVNGGDWENLVRYEANSSGTQYFDISSRADGQEDVQIRWRYYDVEWEWFWGVDDVLLSGDPVATPTPTAPPPVTATPTPAGYKTPSPTATPSPTPGICTRIDEGFDDFVEPDWTVPAGWTFSGIAAGDVYTDPGDYGHLAPSLKFDTGGDYVETAEFLPGEWLQFWVKGQGTDATSSLLVEEYYGGLLLEESYGGWSEVTDISGLPHEGTVFTGLPLDPLTSRLRFTYQRSLGELAFDDVLVKCRPTPTPDPAATPTAPPPVTATPTPAGYKTPSPAATPSPTPGICTRIDEGFDDFVEPDWTVPAGWTFSGIAAGDVYTDPGDYGHLAPSLKLDTGGDYVETAEFLPGEWLQFWVKGQGTDATSSLLVEEYYGGLLLEEYYGGWSPVTDISGLPHEGTVFTGLPLDPLTSRVRFTYQQSLGELSFDDVLVKCLITPTPDPAATPTPAPSPSPTPENYMYHLVLDYSTYLGGGRVDTGWDIAVDSSDSAYVVGNTYSSDFPTASALQPSYSGDWDTVVAKLAPDGGSLVYSTYLGGSLSDVGVSIALGPDDSAVITGYTYSEDFPTVNPYQGARIGGVSDAYVSRISPDGGELLFSSYLGGTGRDVGHGVAVDGEGDVYLVGHTTSGDFPTLNAFQAASGSTTFFSGFVTKLSSDGSSLVYSTYLGGSAADLGRSIAVDGDGSAYVVGETESEDFPTVNPLQPVFGGGRDDAFLSKFSPDGQSLVYSSYLGGESRDRAGKIAVNSAGEVYILGNTLSGDFPVVDAFQPTLAGGTSYGDAFLARVSADGSTLIYSTYLGGSGEERVQRGLAVAEDNYVYLAGWTSSTDLPVYRAFQADYGGGSRDAFAAAFYPSGELAYCTYLGGSGEDSCLGAALDSSKRFYLTGETASLDFPLEDALQPDYGGGSKDMFVTRLEQVGYLTTPTPSPSPTPSPTASPSPTPEGYVIPTPSATPTPTPIGYRTPTPTATPTSTPVVEPTPLHLVVDWDDYSGDGASDIAVYRPSTGEWNILGVTAGLIWGGGEGDIPVPGDYDGDGKADVGYFDRFTGKWYVLSLSQGVLLDGEQWGEWGDIPVPGDYTGDGTADLAVFRPSTNRWWIRNLTVAHWGWPGDIPVPGDYDGDGTTDIAMLRPSTGHWFIRGVGQAPRWYQTGDLAMPMDYTGDGSTELAVYRPSTGRWFFRKLDGSYTAWRRWGLPEQGDLPVVGDFDGDGLADPTIFRPGENRWYILSSFGPYYYVDFSAQTVDSFVTGATAY